MPTTYANINDLLTSIVDRIKPNGLQEITGQVHQDVMLDTVLSIINYIDTLPADIVNSYPAWDNGTTYDGGVEVVVRHNDKLWVFVSGVDDLGTEPSTNAAVWSELSAVAMAHFRNKDQALDQDGPNEVTAAQILAHMNDTGLHAGGSTWLPPVLAMQATPPVSPTEGDSYIVASGATGAWVGHVGQRAKWVSGAWVFSDTANGDMCVPLNVNGKFLKKETGSWALYNINDPVPSLAQVLVAGQYTGAGNIVAQRAIVHEPTIIVHNTPGFRIITVQQSSRVYIEVLADISIQLDNPYAWDLELVLENTGLSPRNIAWDPLQFETSVATPTSIAPGEAIVLALRPYGLTGTMTVVSNSQAMEQALYATLDTDGAATANSDARVMSQKASRTYIASQIAALVAASPSTLDTLNELAAALGNDPNFATTVTTALANKQPLSSVLTTLASASANGQSLVTAANYAAMRSLLGLVIGSNVQAYSSTLDALAASSAFFQTLASISDVGGFLGAICSLFWRTTPLNANYTAVSGDRGRVLDVTTGSSTITITLPSAATAGDGFLIAVRKTDNAAGTVVTSPATQTLTSRFQTMVLRSDGSNWSVATMYSDGLANMANASSNGQSLVNAANYAAMRTLLSLVPGTDVQAYSAKLAAIHGLTWAANKLIRTTGTSTVDSVDVSSTPGANTVPIADGSSKLDGWVSAGSTSAAGLVRLETNGGTNTGRAVQADDYRLPIRATLTADATSTSTSLADVSDLSIPLAANGNYEVDAILIIQTSTGTTGLNISLNGPASPNNVVFMRQMNQTSGQQTQLNNSYDQGTASDGLPSTNTDYYCRLGGLIRNGANAGNLVVRLASEVGGSTVRIKAGSYLRVTRIS